MLKIEAILLILTLFSSCSSETVSTETNLDPIDHQYFYDFKFDFYVFDQRAISNNSNYSIIEEFKYFGEHSISDSFKIKHIIHTNSDFIKLINPIEDDISCDGEKMNLIYQKIVKKLTPCYIKNDLSIQKNSGVSVDNEWGFAKIDLDLGAVGGDSYGVSTQDYEDLISLILSH